MFSHAIFMPGMPRWMGKVDHDHEVNKPDSYKGYTVGDNTNKHLAKHPWRNEDVSKPVNCRMASPDGDAIFLPAV